MGWASAQDPQGWKRPWGLWGWGLGSRNRRSPGMPPTPGLRGQGTSPGSPAGFLGSSGWAKHPPLLLLRSGVWEGPSLLPLLISLASLLCPQDQCGWGWGGRGHLGGQGTSMGAQQAPRAEWVGQSPSIPLPLLPEGPSHLHLLISPASGEILGGQSSPPVSGSCGETLTPRLPTPPS